MKGAKEEGLERRQRENEGLRNERKGFETKKKTKGRLPSERPVPTCTCPRHVRPATCPFPRHAPCPQRAHFRPHSALP